MARLLPILTYHKISPVDPKSIYPGTYVPPALFRKHLSFLARRGYVSNSVEGALSNGIKDRAIVLTFDDGFADFSANAAPLLESFGMTGQVFLVADRLGKTNDWDTQIGDVVADLMTVPQILEMASRGHTFGSHTMTHADLNAIGGEIQSKEITDSKVNLESSLGFPVRTFCYPYGRFSGETRGLVADAGYEFAVSTKKGINSEQDDRLMLKRIAIRNDTILPVFIYKLFRAERFGK